MNNNLIPLKNVFYFSILIQFISVVHILYAGSLNGDFTAFEDINMFVLFLSFIASICPFYFLYLYLKQKEIKEYSSIGEIKYFDTVVISLLLINIFLALKYKVGRLASHDIYQVPFFVKPFIVIVNRIDAYVISGYFIVSNLFSKKNNIIVIVLLMILSLSRASVFVFLFLILIYSLSGKLSFSLKKLIIFSVIFLLTFQFIPLLFDYRESLRNGDEAKLIEIFDTTELVKFVLAKLIGRVSSLSAVEFFFEHYHQIVTAKKNIGDLDFIIEFFRPFFGGFFRDELKSYTYFFTNIYDPNAGSDYGVMYALPGVLLLSYIKGIHVLLMNIVFIIVVIVFMVQLASFLFGKVYREFVYILLFGPLMSGVPAEFGQLLFYLLVLSFLKLFYRQIMIKN
ncbi:oligosaccharide repeat unit polymerase [Flavobacterium sp. WC2430]|uniref:oligosaccharide repeat unit polymerase n=1 Tax=Flavobacterium sp. WC2430 TaxID=3234137 RepID=UPI0034664EA3